MLSVPHLAIIFIIALLVFGPEKLPELARMLGKAMAEFRRVTYDVRRVVEDEMRDMERQAREAERQKQEAAATVHATENSILPPVAAPAASTMEPGTVPLASGAGSNGHAPDGTIPTDRPGMTAPQEAADGAALDAPVGKNSSDV
jgi:sec-independent protein translocase protein TatB